MRSCHGGKQVRRERRNATFTRQVVADKRDLANCGTFFHEAVFHSSRPAQLMRKNLCANCKCAALEREVGRSVLQECRSRPSGGGFQGTPLYRSDAGAGARKRYSRGCSDRVTSTSKRSSA